MIRIQQGLFIAALGFAVSATGAFDAAAAGGWTRGGGAGFSARAVAPPRRVGPVQPPRRVEGPIRPRRVGPHDPRRRIDGLVAPLYGYGYVPGYGGVIVVLPPQPASAAEPAPPPRVVCKLTRETIEVPAEGGGTQKVSVTRCAGE